MSERTRQPIFNVPGSILSILALLAAVHAAREWLVDDDDGWLVVALAFIPARYAGTGAAAELPGGWAGTLLSPFTHMVLHADWTHLGLNAAWLLVFGSIVARRLGSVRLFAFFILTGLAGAALFTVVHWGALLPMIGASGAVSGLMGGAIRLFHSVLRIGAFRDLALASEHVPLASVPETLRDRQVLIIVAVTLLMNVLLGASGSLLTPGSGGIAWEAHVGGFAAGLLGFGFLDPGPKPLPRRSIDESV